MRALLIGGVSLGLLALSTQACAKGPPSRSEVARIVAEEFEQPGVQRHVKLWLAYATMDREGRNPSDARRDQENRDCLEALIAAGLVTTPPTFAGIDTGLNIYDEEGNFLRTPPYFMWQFEPAPAAQGQVAKVWGAKLWDSVEVTAAEVVTATPELLRVTGITAPTEGLGAGHVEAQFAYRLSLTPFGHVIAETPACPGHDQIPGTEEKVGALNFEKFDDGWRHGELKGPSGLPIELYW